MKGTSRDMYSLKAMLKLNGVAVDRIGMAGGLSMLWNKELHVDLLSFSSNHIEIAVLHPGASQHIRFTGFYGHSSAPHRAESCHLICRLNMQHHLPWFIGAGFNEILMNSEEIKRLIRTQCQMDGFNVVLSDCSQYYPYTWPNNRESLTTVMCRLDRVCANGAGLQCYPCQLSLI